MTDDVEELPVPRAVSGLETLRALIAALPAPTPASLSSARSGSQPLDTPDATSQMAAPLSPQPESFIITNPTSSKMNLLDDPTFDQFALSTPVYIAADGAWHDLTAAWQGAVVVNSGTFPPAVGAHVSKHFERGSVYNPFNTATLLVSLTDNTSNLWSIDLFLSPTVAYNGSGFMPTNDFLVAQAVAWEQTVPANPPFGVVSASLQIVYRQGTAYEAVVDESPLFDLLAGHTGDIQYLVAAASDTTYKFRGFDWSWRIRLHVERTATNIVSADLLHIAEPCLSLGAAPDPVTFAPYIGRWDPAKLVAADALISPFDTSSGQGWSVIGDTTDYNAMIQFYRADYSQHAPELLLGYREALAAGVVEWGPGNSNVGQSDLPDLRLTRKSTGQLILDDAAHNPSYDVALVVRAPATKTPSIIFGVNQLFDVNLYRGGADLLKTDDALYAAGNAGNGASCSNPGTVTVVTTGNWYKLTYLGGVSFTPKYTGQRFLVTWSGALQYDAICTQLLTAIRVDNDTSGTLNSWLAVQIQDNPVASRYRLFGGSSIFVAAAGDVGSTRYIYVYVQANTASNNTATFYSGNPYTTHVNVVALP